MKKFRFLLAMLAITLAFVTCSGGGRAAPATDFAYDLTSDGTGIVIKKYTGNGGNLVIPDKIEGYPVVELGPSAFYGEDNTTYGPGYNITSVVIPASVKLIGGNCFNWIENLKSVTIQGTDVVIDANAFAGNINLEELKIQNGDNVLIPRNVYGTIMTAAFSRSTGKLPLATRTRLQSMGFTAP